MSADWVVELPALFVLGLFGGAHCIGMCGGFVLIAHGAGASSRGAARLAAYLSGKTATYAVLGVLAGALGHLVGGVSGAQTALSIAVGVFLVLIGLGAAGMIPERLPGFSVAGPWIGRALGRIVRSGGTRAPLVIGLLNGLLPCGLVYAALAKAATTGSAGGGAAAMAVFGVGTMPALVLTAWLGGQLGPVARRRVARTGGWLVVAFGVYTLWRTFARMGGAMPAHG